MTLIRAAILVPFAASILAGSASAASTDEDVYLTIPLADLEWTEGASTPDLRRSLGAWELRSETHPRVKVEGVREAYLALPLDRTWGSTEAMTLGETRLGIRAEAPRGDVTGELLLPDGDGITRYPFRISLDDATFGARAEFLQARYLHYMWLYKRDLPGAAWFRHQAMVTRDQLDLLPGGSDVTFDPDGVVRGFRGRSNDIDRTFSLFSGGRALAENLALDEVVEVDGEGLPDIPVDDIEGITLRAMEFPVDGPVDLDPLAGRIPVDQHALFFPTFGALVRVLDEARANGAPVLELLDASSEDAGTQARYERQLCLPLDTAARTFGDTLIESVAITGGDPYLRTGSDVAVILRARQQRMLDHFLGQRYDDAEAEHGARAVTGQIRGVAYQGVVSDDRSICSYRLWIENDLVVGNSLPGLENIVAAAQGKADSLLAAPEYPFFRERYPRGSTEDAFLVLTDATIRRWCGPRWRIAASRRTRAAAVLADGNAIDLDARIVRGETLPYGVLADAFPIDGTGGLRRTPSGRFSDDYGSDRFLTPIVEMDVDYVSPAERLGYENFRSDYQRRWSQVFDPIAATVVVHDDGVELDLSVVPIVVRSEYREIFEMSRGATLGSRDGDPHDGALLQFAMALGRESWIFREGGGFAGSILPGLTDPFSWIGDDVSIWIDQDDAFFAEVAASGDPEDFLEDNYHRLPIGFRLPSTNPLKLAALVSGLRGLVDSSSPGLVRFETREFEGRGYVAILPEDFEDWVGVPLTIYYATLPDAFVASFSEKTLQGALARFTARRAGEDTAATQDEWLGESAGLRISSGFHGMIEAIVGDEWARERRALSWRSLPILDEWRRLGIEDPVAFHAQAWGITLRCPGGGEYRWNESLAGFESTTFGRPEAPREGDRLQALVRALERADFGLTFSDGGVRARVRLVR